MLTKPSPAQNSPRPDEVRDALERVVASEEFQASPQLVTILRYLVDAALRGEKLKAYTIAIEALGRNLHFDAQLDPIVRVEATRLRRALARYYVGPGRGDPVIIDLPSGGYTPIFSRNSAGFASRLLKIYRNSAGSSTRIFGVVGVFGAIAAVALAVMVHWGEFSFHSNVSAPTPKGAAASLNGMPTIYVELPSVRESALKPAVRPELLQEKINNAFARFDTINVIQLAASDHPLPEQIDPRPDYVLTSLIENATTATVWFKLVDMSDRTIVWSQAYQQDSPEQPPDITEGTIVSSLANALVQSYGVIRTHDRAKQIASEVGDPRYRCILETAESFRSMEPATRRHARECLDDLTAKDPGFALGHSFLAMVHFRAYQLGVDGRAGDPDELDLALLHARRGVELNPSSARAYQMLFLVLYGRRDIAAAFEAADKAIALNPFDKLTLGEYGSRLVMNGELEKGMILLRQSAENDSVRPPWQHFYLFLGNYLNNDLVAAAHHASQIQGGNYVHNMLAQLLLSSKGLHPESRQEALRQLLQSQPGWGSDPRRELSRMIASPEIVDRLTADLIKVGLPTAHSEIGGEQPKAAITVR